MNPLFPLDEEEQKRLEWHYKSKKSADRLTETHQYGRRVSLEEYCNIIKSWVLRNPTVVSVLEWYQDAGNEPFEYPFDEVCDNEAVRKILDERIKLMALTGVLKSQVFATLYGSKKETQQGNGDEPIKFEIQ